MIASSQLPPFEYFDEPIDVQIRIRQDGSQYVGYIISVGHMHRFIIEMSHHDLSMLNMQLSQAMEQVAYMNDDGVKLSKQQSEENLTFLAENGYYAFRRIFSGEKTLQVLQNIFSISSRISIQITSEDFFIPWELLYPHSFERPLSYNHFWGFRYSISRIIVQDNPSGSFISPIIAVKTCPSVGLFTDTTLPAVVELEIPFFEKIQNDGKIDLFKLRTLDPHPGKKQSEIFEFKKFWQNGLNIAHFACHAEYKTDLPDQSYITLSNGFVITLMDLTTYDVIINHHPLVIMNACKTGNLNPLYTSYFAASFLRRGARGIVATECVVPDIFAASFAQKMYDRFLEGQRLGDLLLATRLFFLREHDNPTGLLYSMYASPAIRLAKEIQLASGVPG